MNCIKVKYSNEKKALTAKNMQNKVNDYQLTRAYKCKECHCWHLTSQKNNFCNMNNKKMLLVDELHIGKLYRCILSEATVLVISGEQRVDTYTESKLVKTDQKFIKYWNKNGNTYMVTNVSDYQLYEI